MEQEQHYVILSSGAYSDYFPIYFVGTTKVSQEVLEAKSLEIGDAMWVAFEAGEKEPWQYRPDEDSFIKRMSDWLYSLGYTKLPDKIPEINVYYDVPRSKEK